MALYLNFINSIKLFTLNQTFRQFRCIIKQKPRLRASKRTGSDVLLLDELRCVFFYDHTHILELFSALPLEPEKSKRQQIELQERDTAATAPPSTVARSEEPNGFS